MTGFTYDGKDYQPKMTRAGVRAAEVQGLSASEIAEKPFSAINLLLFAALWSGYKLNANKVTAMLDDMLESGEVEFGDLFSQLSEAYVELFGSGESEKKD
jgi:hypothetical protein